MREPKCPYFGTCGGCSTQHLEYDLQLSNKVKNVAMWLNLNPELIKVFHSDDYAYRNRMDFIAYRFGFGLRENGNWNKIVEIEKCPISNEKLNKLLSEVRSFFIDRTRHGLRYVVIRAPSLSSSVSFVIAENSNYKNKNIALENVKEFAKKTTADNIIAGFVPGDKDESVSTNFQVLKGAPYLKEKFNDMVFEYHSQGFFQNNSIVAEKMINYVKDLMANKKGHLLDLYGGVGVFGLSMHNQFENVTIVESSTLSIECSERNIVSNKIRNAEAFAVDAKNIMKLRFRKPLHVVTDPPRTGMDQKALSRLIDLFPETIIYISCNPQQFKNEMVKFLKKGYVVKSVALFDMFPQTNHIEIIVEMAR